MARRIASPLLVGRNRELEYLELAFERAKNENSTTVVVTGEAGVGKSRLVAEFLAELQGQARVLVGACVDLGTGDLPYAPFVDVLRGLARSVDEPTLARLAGPGSRQLAHLVPGFASADLADADTARRDYGASSKARLFEAILSLLERVTLDRPLVVVIEDLHWADRSTRDLFAFLVRSMRAPGALLVATVRTEGLGRDHPIPAYVAELTRHERVERIDLAGLDKQGTARQVAAIRGAPAEPAILDRIVSQSDGNPFVVEELLAAGLAAAEVPPTLRQIVMSRVAERGTPAQEVLRILAVGGLAVDHETLSAVSGAADGRLSRALRELVDHDLLTLDATTDEYRFRHVLVRDAVYADVLPGERRRLHRRYAECLADRPAGTRDRGRVAARIAHHWDRSGDPRHAFDAYLEAAAAAERVVAYPEALRHYRRAIDLQAMAEPGIEGPTEIDVLGRAAEAAYEAGEFGEALQLAEKVRGRIDPVTDRLTAALAGERSSRAMWAVGDERAVATLVAAVELLADQPPSREYAAVLAAQARMLMLHSDLGRAEEVCHQAIAVARATGATLEGARALITLAVARAAHGGTDEGVGLAREGIAQAEQAGDVDEVARGYLDLHWILSSVGRLAEALATAEEGTAMASRLGSEWSWGGVLIANRAETLLMLGLWDEASALIEAVLARDPQGMIELDVRAARASLRIGRGDFAGAGVDAERISQLAELSDAERLALYRTIHMTLAVWEGRWEDGRQTVQAALRTLMPDDRHVYLPMLVAGGLRAEADLSTLARARRDTAELAASREIADNLIARLRVFVDARPVDPGQDPRFAAHVAICEAEYTRVTSHAAAAAWRAAVDAVDRYQTPFDGAYARFRLAEALLAGRDADRVAAAGELRAAHETTVMLRADALRREIEQLAIRARIDLDQPAGADPALETKLPEPEIARLRALGLTPREAEVLDLLASGRTNRQISVALFVTEKTAALHVSNILAKLGAANRVEAASIAHRTRPVAHPEAG